jgi:predicted ATPase/DNA-binding XRE family transcriptional regulator
VTQPTASPGPGPFAVRLRRLREAAALTQEELASRAGLTVKAVGALERGERRRPYPHTIRALADALALDEQARTELIESTRRLAADPGPPAPAAPVGPPPVSPLLGREAELAEVLTLLRSAETRLLTITGPGGVGKTSLANAAAAGVADHFPAGVAVVELAAVRDVALVLPTVGRVLGLTQLGSSDVLAALAGYVGGRRQLIVLDNLEHLLDAAVDLAALLDRCPGLVVLATSRAPLRLRLEQEYPLGPLPLPRTGDLAAVAASPAAQMFLHRARTVNPALELSAANARAVAAICGRLDGLPLALELAAAHARLLPPPALLDRLSSALSLVRRRDLPERHRTMTATLDWSHDLLTRDEQRLLRRLSVFAGGFSLTAAEEVAGEDGTVLPVLAGLVEQSLVTPDFRDEARYRMLEPVREYAAERLRSADEVEQLRGRHADYFYALAVRGGRELRTRGQAEWLDRLERDHNNLQVAVSTLRAQGDLGRVARLVTETWLYWVLRGHTGEARVALEEIVRDASTGMSAADRATAYLGLAGIRYAAGDIPGTRAAATAVVELTPVAGTDELLADALMLQGGAAVFDGDLDAAVAPLAEAADRAVVTGDDFVLAQTRFAQGQLQFRAGNLETSVEILAQAEAIARRAGLPFSLAVVLNMQAVVADVTGADDLALGQLSEAGALAAEVRTTWPLVYTLPALGVLAARRGLFETAAVLFAAGIATAEASAVAVSFPPSREGAEHWLATVRRELDPESWARAEEAGRTLPLDQLAGLAAQIRQRGPS